MRDPSMGHGYRALYQGPTLVGPQRAEKELGFSPCGSTKSDLTINPRSGKRNRAKPPGSGSYLVAHPQSFAGFWPKDEGVNGPMKIAPAQNFAVVIDARGYQQLPAGIGRDQLVQVDHFALLPEEGPDFSIVLRSAYHLGLGIDVQGRTRRLFTTQGAEIRDGA